MRYAFCAKISSVCSFLGRSVTSECVLPFIECALVDVEEKVIVKAINCLNTLVISSLLSEIVIYELIDIIIPMLLHPSDTVRDALIDLVVSISRSLGDIYSNIYLISKLYPDYIECEIKGVKIDKAVLLSVLKTPISRKSYKIALLQKQRQLVPTASSPGKYSTKSSSNNNLNGIDNNNRNNIAIDLSNSFSVITTINKTSDLNNSFENTNESNIKVSSERESEIGFGIGSVSISNDANYSRTDSNTFIQQSDEEIETNKLQIMNKYITRAAQEMSKKPVQWRNGTTAGTAVNGFTAAPGKSNLSSSSNGLVSNSGSYENSNLNNGSNNAILSSTRLDSILEVNSNHLPDHSLQSILIPNQKFGISYFNPITNEELRNDLIQNVSQIKSLPKIISLFGIVSKQTDVGRNIPLQQAQQTIQTQNSVQNQLLNPIRTSLTSENEEHYEVNAVDPKTSQNSTDIPSKGPHDSSESKSTMSNSSSILSLASIVKSKIFTTLVPPSVEVTTLLKRIKALGIPPLPPDVGTLIQPDERKYNSYIEPLDISISTDTQSNNRNYWKPKENILACSLVEHTNSINRLSVSPDQTFFISASADKTAKVWSIRGIDRLAFPKSCFTYNKHNASILDITMIENSHSVATSSDDGVLHIWRVDLGSTGVSNSPNTSANDLYSTNANTSSSIEENSSVPSLRVSGVNVNGYSQIRTLNPVEGSIVSLQHYNSDIASILVYITQQGFIHGWDMRSCKESFVYQIRPELGHPTASTLSPDRHWICIGTSKGYIAIWDLRFHVMCQLFHHSSNSMILRLANSKNMPNIPNNGISNSPSVSNNGGIGSSSKLSSANLNGGNQYENAYLIISAGVNEISVFSIPEGGECLKCFRSISKKDYLYDDSHIAPLPYLRPVSYSSHPLSPIISISERQQGLNQFQSQNGVHTNLGTSNSTHGSSFNSIRSIIGRISQSSESYIITGGNDKYIRFWDFLTPSKCYVISGLEPTQQKPTFDAPLRYNGKLFISYDTEVPSTDTVLQAQLPVREGRGPLQPLNSFKVN